MKFDFEFIIVKRVLVKHNVNSQSMDVVMREKTVRDLFSLSSDNSCDVLSLGWPFPFSS